MKHTMVALMHDNPGALNRVVSVFRRNGLNIDRMTVSPAHVPRAQRITIVADIDDVGRVLRQLTRLIDVLDARVVDSTNAAELELPAELDPPFTWQADGALS